MRTVVKIRSSEPETEIKNQDEAPTIWFDSWRQLAGVLSDENRALLRTMKERQPRTVLELSVLSGRAPSNLSRTLKTLQGYGLVRLHRSTLSRAVMPEAISTEFLVMLD